MNTYMSEPKIHNLTVKDEIGMIIESLVHYKQFLFTAIMIQRY